MNKGVLRKINLAAVAITLMGTASAIMPMQTSTVVAQKVATKKVGFHVYKKGSRQTSMAQSFIGKNGTVKIVNGKISSFTIHVDGSKNKLGQGQDVAKIVKSLTINHKKGKKTNIAADHNSFDFVFPGSAVKSNGKVSLNVTIDFGGDMHESADLKFAKISGLKTVKKTNHKKVSHKKRAHKKSKKRSHKRTVRRRVSKRRHHRSR